MTEPWDDGARARCGTCIRLPVVVRWVLLPLTAALSLAACIDAPEFRFAEPSPPDANPEALVPAEEPAEKPADGPVDASDASARSAPPARDAAPPRGGGGGGGGDDDDDDDDDDD